MQAFQKRKLFCNGPNPQTNPHQINAAATMTSATSTPTSLRVDNDTGRAPGSGESEDPAPLLAHPDQPHTPQRTAAPTPTPQQDFFTRNGLSWGDKLLCDDIAQSLFPAPSYTTSPHAWQGWCSYSVLARPSSPSSSSSSSSFPSNPSSSSSSPPPPPSPTKTEPNPPNAQAFLIQFRSPRHAIDARVMNAARAVYGPARVPSVVRAGSVVLWPRAVGPARELLLLEGKKSIEEEEKKKKKKGEEKTGTAAAALGLELCAMTLLPGVPYGVVQARRAALAKEEEESAWQGEVVRGFAAFMASGWTRGGDEAAAARWVGERGLPARLHAATPAKLERLGRELPTPWLRGRAVGVLRRYRELGFDALPGDARPSGRKPLVPFTLNHGDVVPGNIIVDEGTGELNGLVDWAEAEVGLWGLGLYGLEFLLGYVSSSSRSEEQGRHGESGSDSSKNGVAWGAEGKGTDMGRKEFSFTYYEQAPELRALFWSELERRLGGSFIAPEVREAIDVVRDVGVLLWFGFAWDDGKIDQVIDAREDPRELLLLETFLQSERSDGGEEERAKL